MVAQRPYTWTAISMSMMWGYLTSVALIFVAYGEIYEGEDDLL